MVGVWEGLNLGSIPNDHMPSQKDPKISIERRCSTILPNFIGANLHFVGNIDNKLPFLGIFGPQIQVKCRVLLSQLFK